MVSVTGIFVNRESTLYKTYSSSSFNGEKLKNWKNPMEKIKSN